MDRNSIIGIILIVAIFIIMGKISAPSKEELEQTKHRNDSIAYEYKIKSELDQAAQLKLDSLKKLSSSTTTVSEQTYLQTIAEDTAKSRIFTLENDLISVQFSEKGGRPYSVKLKKYQTHDSLPIYLFHGDSSIFNLNFLWRNLPINTNEKHFTCSSPNQLIMVNDSTASIAMRLTVEDGKYIEYRYILKKGKYQLDLDIEMVGMKEFMETPTSGVLDLDWMLLSPQQEKGRDNELSYTTLYYRNLDGEVDNFNPSSKKEVQSEKIATKIEWVAYKDQFFTSVIMADNAFQDNSFKAEIQTPNSKYLKKFESKLGLVYKVDEKSSIPLHFYFGPVKYKLLKKEYGDKHLHDLVMAGKSIIKFFNQKIIIRLFDFLNSYISNYGLIILLLTLIIKIGLLPLTFKSYMSTAKMKVLKPQIDEITNAIPKEKPMERQQATMAFYKKVGVSPLGGCLPMILQMPILFAMFRFFPTSIELRQQSFLWATDLSTYDSIFEWSVYIPILSNYFGNHLSLFTLLMTASTILTMKINNQASASSQQMPGMKAMMYIMPIMFMFMLNKFSSGLTYYYFLANMITFGQNILFNQFVDEAALLKKLELRKSKPVKKSNFQKKMEQMAKMQQGKKSLKRK